MIRADEYVFEAIRSAAAGFLLKDTSPEDLRRAVRLVAGGDALLAPAGSCGPPAPVRGRPPTGSRS